MYIFEKNKEIKCIIIRKIRNEYRSDNELKSGLGCVCFSACVSKLDLKIEFEIEEKKRYCEQMS